MLLVRCEVNAQCLLGFGFELADFSTIWSCTACHVWLASAFATDNRGEGLDELACHESRCLRVVAAQCAEMELRTIVDDEEGRLRELLLLETIHQLLQ